MVTGAGDSLALSDDGGQTLRTVRAPGRIMSSFARLGDGHLLVGWIDIDRGYLDRSTDGGETFTTLATTLHTSALAERGATSTRPSTTSPTATCWRRPTTKGRPGAA